MRVLTQDDLAEKLYVSRQLVSKWENGTGVPSIDVLLDLAKLFHITFEELLCLNDENNINPDDIFHTKLHIPDDVPTKYETAVVMVQVPEDYLFLLLISLYRKISRAKIIRTL